MSLPLLSASQSLQLSDTVTYIPRVHEFPELFAPLQHLRCFPKAGISNSQCGAYSANRWWLPDAYVNNATCACQTTPNDATANCVRKFLQDRLAAYPPYIVQWSAFAKQLGTLVPWWSYEGWVQGVLTPLIYQDHVDAYRECCCPCGPAPYPAWIGVTSVPLPCGVVGESIRWFGSCHCTPGAW